ncbi:uncharacterized protein LOC143231866 [Tachypleus tridentatus]|uniref:uncharacterized protein LOC143231866 n=1 Tax=Tachypleus tridentatus TaxID=6853 RepID=UPI003FD5EA9B
MSDVYTNLNLEGLAEKHFRDSFLLLGNDCRVVVRKIRKELISLGLEEKVKTVLLKIEETEYRHWIIKVDVDDSVVIDSTVLQFCFPLKDTETKHIKDKYNTEKVKIGWCNNVLDYQTKTKLEECEAFQNERRNIVDKPYYVGRMENHPLHQVLVFEAEE